MRAGAELRVLGRGTSLARGTALDRGTPLDRGATVAGPGGARPADGIERDEGVGADRRLRVVVDGLAIPDGRPAGGPPGDPTDARPPGTEKLGGALNPFGFDERPDDRVLDERGSVVDGRFVTGGAAVTGARGVERAFGGPVGNIRFGVRGVPDPSSMLPRVTRDGGLLKFGSAGG